MSYFHNITMHTKIPHVQLFSHGLIPLLLSVWGSSPKVGGMREPGNMVSKVVNLWSVNLVGQQNDLTRTYDYTRAFTVTLRYELQWYCITLLLLGNAVFSFCSYLLERLLRHASSVVDNSRLVHRLQLFFWSFHWPSGQVREPQPQKWKPLPCHAPNHASWLCGIYSNFNEHRENTERLRVCTTIQATSLLGG